MHTSTWCWHTRMHNCTTYNIHTYYIYVHVFEYYRHDHHHIRNEYLVHDVCEPVRTKLSSKKIRNSTQNTLRTLYRKIVGLPVTVHVCKPCSTCTMLHCICIYNIRNNITCIQQFHKILVLCIGISFTYHSLIHLKKPTTTCIKLIHKNLTYSCNMYTAVHTTINCEPHIKLFFINSHHFDRRFNGMTCECVLRHFEHTFLIF